MSEVKRYSAALTHAETSSMYEAPDGEWVVAMDFDRVTAERDALQQRLNANDQRVDDLSSLMQALVDNPFKFTDAYRARMAAALNPNPGAESHA
ncbi:hypothetical protein C3E97_027675 [Pseudomonas sp. MWU12-2115]|uniref:hypothetical protein n=1 Tax=unclassified Pseudomonas TaxID=196821 RepID=UPI000CD4EB42|nr:hypothetical protein [Pseudomonas sp. MWU12-2020]RBB97499.1 hypothetical protein C3E97_027675 [Pseudomonas sp. MWU12-2115]